MTINLNIDIDEEKKLVKLTWREQAGIRILLIIFGMIYPAKYTHQTEKLLESIFEGQK
jgi:hypothetical protein